MTNKSLETRENRQCQRKKRTAQTPKFLKRQKTQHATEHEPIFDSKNLVLVILSMNVVWASSPYRMDDDIVNSDTGRITARFCGPFSDFGRVEAELGSSMKFWAIRI
mmetsp:Transcript_18873/g.39634  ORF Transcript_18873/g.39634 Transcript_18873/m.39634 type:complete len:107 (+) Transcript_18873:264-584(+)